LLELRGRQALLDVAGVGYEVECSSDTVKNWLPGQEVTVVTYTEVREDALRLHGFADRLEREVFLLLLKVKGVGVRSASELISQINKHSLLKMIANSDVQGLATSKGLGKKTAERIVLELKDKVGEFVILERQAPAIAAADNVESEALAALMVLGFSAEQARSSYASVINQGEQFADVGALVGACLRQLSQ
jgi:Holliday junction DNA helicase RuvA